MARIRIKTPSGLPRAVPEGLASHLAVIEVRDIHKTYANGTQAVRGVSFHVRKGEFFGILGPNGAGKSTLIGMLGTLVRPTQGQAFVAGMDVTQESMKVRSSIGFAMQEAGVDELATGREFLILQGRLYGLDAATAKKRAAQLLQLFELEGAADKRVGGYSGGMKRRIDLAAALIHLPPILFLDEPTEGLDPRSRQTMWATLERLNQKLGTTVLLSTHYMDEADRLCDRIAIIDQGMIVVEGTPEQLKQGVGGQSVVLDWGQNGGASQLEKAHEVVAASRLAPRVQRSGTELHAYVSDAAEAAPKILRALDAAKLPPASLRIERPTLDDVYLKYTGRKIQEAEAKVATEAKKK